MITNLNNNLFLKILNTCYSIEPETPSPKLKLLSWFINLVLVYKMALGRDCCLKLDRPIFFFGIHVLFREINTFRTNGIVLLNTVENLILLLFDHYLEFQK